MWYFVRKYWHFLTIFIIFIIIIIIIIIIILLLLLLLLSVHFKLTKTRNFLHIKKLHNSSKC